MSRITKSIAEKVAIRLCEKLYAVHVTCKNDLADYVRGEFLSDTPIEIRHAYDKFPGYFSTTNVIMIDGYGNSREFISVKKVVTSSSALRMDAERGTEIRSLRVKSDIAEKEYEETRDKLIGVLLALRTYAKIAEAIPEAIPLLPAQNALCVALCDINNLRNKIK